MEKRKMKKGALTTAVICATVLLMSQYGASDNRVSIENFESYMKSPFPQWKMRKTSASVASRVYSIKSEGDNKYLHASTASNTNLSIQIVKVFRWNIWKKPHLTWRWRALRLPAGANETTGRTNDSAAGIYVLFQRSWSPYKSWKKKPINVIKYVWSSTLPKGKRIHKRARKKFGVTYYEGTFYVLQSGTSNLGKWITERRNVLADYRRAFGKKPRYRPMAIGILTDSNAVKNPAIADYDDFMIE